MATWQAAGRNGTVRALGLERVQQAGTGQVHNNQLRPNIKWAREGCMEHRGSRRERRVDDFLRDVYWRHWAPHPVLGSLTSVY